MPQCQEHPSPPLQRPVTTAVHDRRQFGFACAKLDLQDVPVAKQGGQFTTQALDLDSLQLEVGLVRRDLTVKSRNLILKLCKLALQSIDVQPLLCELCPLMRVLPLLLFDEALLRDEGSLQALEHRARHRQLAFEGAAARCQSLDL